MPPPTLADLSSPRHFRAFCLNFDFLSGKKPVAKKKLLISIWNQVK